MSCIMAISEEKQFMLIQVASPDSIIVINFMCHEFANGCASLLVS